MPQPEISRLFVRRPIDHDQTITASEQLQLSAEEKLTLLKQADRWRPWFALQDQRLCLGCGRLISGDEIEMTQAADGGEVEAHCPTRGCQSNPLDWILPNPRDRESNA